MEPQERRIRLGAKQTAKGTVTLDVTSEAETVEAAAEGLTAAIQEMKKRVTAEGFELAG